MKDETTPRADKSEEEESVHGLRTGDDSTLASRVVQLGPMMRHSCWREWDVRGSAVLHCI